MENIAWHIYSSHSHNHTFIKSAHFLKFVKKFRILKNLQQQNGGNIWSYRVYKWMKSVLISPKIYAWAQFGKPFLRTPQRRPLKRSLLVAIIRCLLAMYAHRIIAISDQILRDGWFFMDFPAFLHSICLFYLMGITPTKQVKEKSVENIKYFEYLALVCIKLSILQLVKNNSNLVPTSTICNK